MFCSTQANTAAMVCQRALKLQNTSPTCRLDDVHVDAIVAEVLRRLDRPRFEAPKYAVDLDARAQVQHNICSMQSCHASSQASLPALHAMPVRQGILSAHAPNCSVELSTCMALILYFL